MPTLPPAILFDLDDTIISAYRQPLAAWLAVAGEMADLIAPVTPERVAAVIARQAEIYWADPDNTASAGWTSAWPAARSSAGRGRN